MSFFSKTGSNEPRRTSGTRYAWMALLAISGSLIGAMLTNRFSQSNLNEVIQFASQRARALTNVARLGQVLSLLKDVETGSRGFVLTGDVRFLEPFDAGNRDLPMAYNELKKEYGAGGPPGFSWPGLDALYGQRLALAAQVVHERKTQGEGAIRDTPLFMRGKETMDEIRESFAVLLAFETRRVAYISTQLDEIRRRGEVLLNLQNLLTAALGLTAVGLILRDWHVRAQLERELRASNVALESAVAHRTFDLNVANVRLKGYAFAQEQVVEGERRRIAREVHDQIGQVFTAIQLIFKALPPGSVPDDQAQALNHALEIGVASSRRITAELRPPLLDDLGLGAALAHLAKGVAKQGHFVCEVDVQGADTLGEWQAMALYRIAQEGTTNVLRHAQATRLSIKGASTAQGYRFSMTDDGLGFDPAQTRPDSMGLATMRERANLMGASLSVTSAPGTGTRVEVLVALGQEAKGVAAAQPQRPWHNPEAGGSGALRDAEHWP